MTFDEWEQGVPEAIRRDTLWHVAVYRSALFLSDLAWADATKLARDQRAKGIADQLFRATGNISSNVAEGYSRGTGKDRARFYEYSLGSAREARDWYFKGRQVLSVTVVKHRILICTDIVKLLLTMISSERRSNRKIAESEIA